MNKKVYLGSLPGDQDLVPGVIIEESPQGPDGSIKLTGYLEN